MTPPRHYTEWVVAACAWLEARGHRLQGVRTTLLATASQARGPVTVPPDQPRLLELAENIGKQRCRDRVVRATRHVAKRAIDLREAALAVDLEPQRLDGFVNLEAAMPIVDHADIAPRIGIEAKHRRDLPYHFRHRPASGHSRTSRAPAAPASALRPWRALPARGRAHDSADRC